MGPNTVAVKLNRPDSCPGCMVQWFLQKSGLFTLANPGIGGCNVHVPAQIPRGDGDFAC